MRVNINFSLVVLCGALFVLHICEAQTFVGQDASRRVITTAVPFLQIPPDARSGGMGDVGAAISPDANSIHWNQAKLALIDKDFGGSVSYTPWLSKIINDMFVAYLTGYKKITKEQAVGLSFRYFDLGDIQFTTEDGTDAGQFSPLELSVDATYSRILTEKFSVGVTGRFFYSNLIGNVLSATLFSDPVASVAVDLGAFYKTDLTLGARTGELGLGASISNIGPKVSYSNDNNLEFIPTNLRVGGAFTLNVDAYNKFTFALDLNKLMVPTPPVYKYDENDKIIVDSDGNPEIDRGKDPDRNLLSGMFGSFGDAPDGLSEEIAEFMVSTGIEYWYNNIFAARAGYNYESPSKGNRRFFTVGIGFRYHVLAADFAYLVPQVQNHPLAETIRVTLGFNVEGRAKEDSILDD